MTNIVLHRRPIAPGSPALFLDRDGVVNRDTGYVTSPSDVSLVAGASASIARMNDMRVPVIVITNQSALARQLADLPTLLSVQERVEELLAEERAFVDAVIICGAGPDDLGQLADWRKPKPGMLKAAEALFHIDLEASALVGDSIRDIDAAHAAGLDTAILLNSSGTSCGRDTIPEASDWSEIDELLDIWRQR